MALGLGKHGGALNIELQRSAVSCAPSLELLPDDILLCIMSLLNVKSLLRVSRVCKRFHHLHRDPSVWRDVDLRMYSGSKMNIISKYFSPSTWRVKMSSHWGHFTTALFDELFTKCPNIRSITLYECNLQRISGDCKLYHCESLEQVFLYSCSMEYKWTETVRPTWPKLTHLCLSNTSNISDSDLEYFASCQETATSLRVLEIYRAGFDGVTDAGMKFICKSMPNLHTLRIRECYYITEESMEDIATLQHLQHLCFASKGLSASAYIRLLKLFPRLKSLHVYLKQSVLQSVTNTEATTMYRDSGVDLHLHKANSLYVCKSTSFRHST